MFNYLLTLESVSDQVNKILNNWVGPLFIMIGACGGIWAVVMGVQYARCENDAKRAELKSRMVNCIIGVVIILVLGTCCIGINWAGVVKIFGYIWEDNADSSDDPAPPNNGDANDYNTPLKPIIKQFIQPIIKIGARVVRSMINR
ncbi:MAG: hypothetical protein E7356_04300 [Clostridiales bacterium]|nr:hypothetical protein [Clostridiales bacterium]